MDPIHIVILITLSFSGGAPDKSIRGAIMQPSYTDMAKCDEERNGKQFADFIEHVLADLREKTNYIKASVTTQCIDVRKEA